MKSKLMTKLAVAAAVVCAAVGGAWADYLYWTVNGVKATRADQYVGYLFADQSTTAVSQKTTLKAITDALTKGTDISSSAYFTAKNTYESTSGTAGFTFGSMWVGQSNNGGYTANMFAVILNGATFSESTGYLVATKDGTAVYNATGSSSTETKYLAFDTVTSTSWTAIGSVPEPTSGVLLLVGVAALALKRKNAA